ncbi:hypothetical protein [Paracoccus sp. (in: a-proteobacteria)]|uniref:hypothetical protein n=1 Tax=Paracoccus sp. TaxID=267 RepID=UPI0032206E3D
MITLDTTAGVAATPARHAKAPADGLEGAFLAEMLKHAGLYASANPFAGAEGESPFSSMLNAAYAESLAARVDLRLLPGQGVAR